MIEVPAPAEPQVESSARLFLALLPDEAARIALAAHADTWQWDAQSNRYALADWHVTLHFIGPVPRQRIDELRAALAAPVTPFELRFGQPELWPHGLAVLLPMAVPEALQRLHARLGHALRRLSLRTDDRPYRPHVTLARHAAQTALPDRFAAFGWQVRGYALMESTGQPGQRYRVLQRYGRDN
jgi:RNA 2',3'-cyclic 3'-phosphodiesterase